jgi:uncharacterized membrane protein
MIKKCIYILRLIGWWNSTILSIDSKLFLSFVTLIMIIVSPLTSLATGQADQNQKEEEQQQQQHEINSLVITLLADGQANVQYDISIDPRKQETNFQLFGQTRNVTAQDKSGDPIGTRLNEKLDNLTLDSLGVTNAIIQYNTPDLTQKDGRIWIFSLNSTTRFSLILPVNSVVIDWGKQNPILIKRAEEQNLITFNPGNIKLKYVTEFPSSNNRADIVINSAETTIKDIKQRYPGIVLSDAERLLQNAINSKSNKKPVDAELFAVRANDLALAVVKKYTSARTIIEQTNVELNRASADAGHDTSSYMALLSQARKLFSEGDYVKAAHYAQKAVMELNANESSLPVSDTVSSSSWSQNILLPYTAPIVAAISSSAAGIILTLILVKRKGKKFSITRFIEKSGGSLISKSWQKKVNDLSSKESNQYPTVKDQQYFPHEPKSSSSSTSSPSFPTTSRQGIDQTVIFQKITKIIEENPHLKIEDQQVLRFLAQNQGAAFESEIRSHFQQLPKTTIWRLVKRLEREELIELRKIAGQNLIRLRFDDKGPYSHHE